MMALLVKATAIALTQYSVVNSSCRNGTSLPYNSSINIAVAVKVKFKMLGFYWNIVCINSLHDIKNSCNNLEGADWPRCFWVSLLGRLSDGKLVAVKVCSDEAQLGANSFVNDVS